MAGAVQHGNANPLDYAWTPDGLTYGNTVRLLSGGAEAFPAMLSAIGSAAKEVLLESYIIADDNTGHAFFDALRSATERGVSVRLICDGFGSLGLPSRELQQLEAAGGQTLIYRPVAPWSARWGLLRRDHRKILVIDRKIGFAGGLNLADEYDNRCEKGRHWRDLHVELIGPSVLSLVALFVRTWNHMQGPQRRMVSHRPEGNEAVVNDGVAVQVVGNRETRHRSLIRNSFLHAVKRAHRSVWIANPYFVPDRKIVRALLSAVRRGVEVRVLVPARSDVLICDLAARAVFPELLRGGVRIAEWQLGMMHAKAAAVDGCWATVGSYNLDRRSLRYNLEVTANVFDVEFSLSVESNLAADFTRSQAVDPEALRNRSWFQRLLSTLAYQFRSWL